MISDDMALVREFAASQSEPAFAALVQRHLGLVHSAALRQVGDAHLAEEIAQAVFIILARKAQSLGPKTVLSAWLYRTTRYAAADALKTRHRRQHREQEAYMQSTLNEPDADTWTQLAPLLDDAMAELGETDRSALVLRFFENKTVGEIAGALRLEEAAAQKRVARALEKLRAIFVKRGVKLTAAVLGGTMAANSVQAAPVGLAVTISAATVKGAAVSGATLTLIKGALKLMAWTKAKTTVVVGVGVLVVAGTTTVAVRKIQEHRVDEVWRTPDLDPKKLDKVPPRVRIVASKFPSIGWVRNNDMKFFGIGEQPEDILGAAFDAVWSPARTMTTVTELPEGRFDFIANLPSGNQEALQQQLKKQFGLVGKIETRETEVLLLKVKLPNAQGLKRSVGQRSGTRSKTGEYIFGGAPLGQLANNLEDELRIPIIDQTGLTNLYDFDLKWNQVEGKPLNLENFKQALTDQLGLELVPSREPIKILVVEKVK